MSRIMLLCCLAGLLSAASVPDDPAWAVIRGAGIDEEQPASRQRVVRDAFGYYAVLKMGSTWDATLGDWTGGGSEVVMRYIPGNGEAMPKGVPDYRGAHIYGAPHYDPYAQEDAEALSLRYTPPAKGYWMSQDEITQADWVAVGASLPADEFNGTRFGSGSDPELAMESVSYQGIGTWISALNAKLASYVPPPGSTTTIAPARLPSEEEWEYAARAGSSTTFAFGPTIRSLGWIMEKLDESRSSYEYVDANRPGLTDPSWPQGVLRRSYGPPWNYRDNGDVRPVGDQSVELANDINQANWIGNAEKHSTRKDSDDNPLVAKITVEVEVTLHILDYFQILPVTDGNFHGRYRVHYVADSRGLYVPVRKRYRRLDSHHYVEDPTVRDSDVYFHVASGVGFRDIPGYAVPSQTHDNDFVKWTSNRSRFDYNWNWYNAAAPKIVGHEEHYRDTTHGNLDGDGVRYIGRELEVAYYQPIYTRYRRVRDGGLYFREDDGNFEIDERGDWIRTQSPAPNSSGDYYVRYQRIGERFNQGVFDPDGDYKEGTLPETDVEPWDKTRVEQEMIAGWTFQGAVTNVTALPPSVTLNAGGASTVASDLEQLKQALAAEWDGALIPIGGRNCRITVDTDWVLKALITFDWSQHSDYLAKDGFGAWEGYDVIPLDAVEKRPNAWGLQNLHGNVGEWTSTAWDGSSTIDNVAANSAFRIVRGGSWRLGAAYARCAARAARRVSVLPGESIAEFNLPQESPSGSGKLVMPKLKYNAITRSGTSIQATQQKPGYDDVGFRLLIEEP